MERAQKTQNVPIIARTVTSSKGRTGFQRPAMGADAVKLQTYRADTITLDSSKKDFCIPSDNPWHENKTLFDQLRELDLI